MSHSTQPQPTSAITPMTASATPNGAKAVRGKIDGQPDPIDVHVGTRIRARRAMLGVTQVQLAELLGLTFQQVQKYERGVNRVSASTLWRAAEALSVPVAYFFEGMDSQIDGTVAELPVDGKTLALAGTIERLTPDLRHAVGALVTALNRAAHD